MQCAFRGDRDIESNYLQPSVEDCEINIIKRFLIEAHIRSEPERMANSIVRCLSIMLIVVVQ